MFDVQVADAPADYFYRRDSQIRALIRKKLSDGTLCEDIAHQIYGGISDGHSCAACDLPIEAGKVLIDTHGKDRVQRRYHPKCHLLLSIELEGLARR